MQETASVKINAESFRKNNWGKCVKKWGKKVFEEKNAIQERKFDCLIYARKSWKMLSTPKI